MHDTRLPIGESASLVFSILILPLNKVIVATPGQTVLEAAAAAAIRLPSSCRNGTCRACLCQMTTGKVRYRVAWPGLSAEEKMSGALLPCVAEPLTDVVLEQAAACVIADETPESASTKLLRSRGF